MEPSELPSHEAVTGEIAELRLGTDASELHGSLCGLLSAGAEVAREDWWLRLALEPAGTPRHEGALDQLFLASRIQLGDPDLGFSLLLPEEDSPLAERADGLLSWCRGFLGGFGLGAVANAALSPEAGEALDDLSKIAASRLSYDDPEGDEAALIEVAEFVRVATLLLYGDGNHTARPSRRLH